MGKNVVAALIVREVETENDEQYQAFLRVWTRDYGEEAFTGMINEVPIQNQSAMKLLVSGDKILVGSMEHG